MQTKTLLIFSFFSTHACAELQDKNYYNEFKEDINDSYINLILMNGQEFYYPIYDNHKVFANTVLYSSALHASVGYRYTHEENTSIELIMVEDVYTMIYGVDLWFSIKLKHRF